MTLKFTIMRRGLWRNDEARIDIQRREPHAGLWTVRHEGAVVGDRDGYPLFSKAVEAARDFWFAKRQAEAHGATPQHLGGFSVGDEVYVPTDDEAGRYTIVRLVAPEGVGTVPFAQLDQVGASGSRWATARPLSEIAKVTRRPVTPTDHANALAARIAEVLAEHAAAPLPVAAPEQPLDPIASAIKANADLGDLLHADELLLRRIVARAKYEALREMLRTLDGWVEGARSNLEAMGRQTADVERGSRTFDVDDIRTMINDAARACGTSEPYVQDAL
jgi:hypothetical protein